jgi:hypothetical protein
MRSRSWQRTRFAQSKSALKQRKYNERQHQDRRAQTDAVPQKVVEGALNFRPMFTFDTSSAASGAVAGRPRMRNILSWRKGVWGLY